MGTGSGKSATLNTLAWREQFESGQGDSMGHAVTKQTNVERVADVHGGGTFLDLIDTQGTHDTEGKDAEYTADIQGTVRSLSSVDVFLLVVHGGCNRLAQYVDTLEVFTQMFGPTFKNRLMICVTHMPYNAGNKRKKKKAEEHRDEKERRV